MFICLPANSTHLTQPLDVALFGPFKKWKDILCDYKRKNAEASAVRKPKFPSLLNRLMQQMKETINANVKSGFRTCGIVPVNREAVKAKLQFRQVDVTLDNSDVISFLRQQRGLELSTSSQPAVALPSTSTAARHTSASLDEQVLPDITSLPRSPSAAPAGPSSAVAPATPGPSSTAAPATPGPFSTAAPATPGPSSTAAPAMPGSSSTADPVTLAPSSAAAPATTPAQTAKGVKRRKSQTILPGKPVTPTDIARPITKKVRGTSVAVKKIANKASVPKEKAPPTVGDCVIAKYEVRKRTIKYGGIVTAIEDHQYNITFLKSVDKSKKLFTLNDKDSSWETLDDLSETQISFIINNRGQYVFTKQLDVA